MSVEILPRQRGAALVCHNCKTRLVTGQVVKRGIRAYAVTQGWGKGSDEGTPYRAAEPAKPSVRGDDGKLIKRARPALPEIPGRPRTTGHDLCPDCLAKDRAASAARKAATAAKRAKRDAKRKAA